MDILQQFENRLLIKNVSKRTLYGYMNIAKALLGHDPNFFSSPQENIVTFLSGKVKEGFSTSYLVQYMAVIQFIRNNIFDIHDKIKITKPIREMIIPDVLTREEFQKIYSITTNLKHKAILALMYSAGLRCGEVAGSRGISHGSWSKRLTRLTYAFSKKWENLRAAFALHFAHYNSCKQHGSLNKLTPAMMAGIADHIWTIGELANG